MVYADIELINATDLVLSKRHIIGRKKSNACELIYLWTAELI